MPDFRLIALDIDGTLLNSERRITPRTREAIASARRAGLLVVLATGRRRQSVAPIAADLGGEPILITTQGAAIWDGLQLIYYQPLAAAAAERVVAHSLAEGVAALVLGSVLDGDYMYVAGPWQANERLRAYTERNRGQVQVYDPALLTDDPVFVFMMDDLHRLTAVHGRLASDSGGEQHWRVIFSRTALAVGAALEALHPTVSKGAALHFLCQRLGLRPDQILAFGDNVNDVEMLEFAGWGIAMSNASPEAIAAADRVTTGNDEDGIAIVLEELGLAPPWPSDAGER